jgi:hypothetical protein
MKRLYDELSRRPELNSSMRTVPVRACDSGSRDASENSRHATCRAACIATGVEFIDENGGGAGDRPATSRHVRLKVALRCKADVG